MRNPQDAHIQNSLEDTVVDVLSQLTSLDATIRRQMHLTLPHRNHLRIAREAFHRDGRQTMEEVREWGRTNVESMEVQEEEREKTSGGNGKVPPSYKVKFGASRSAKKFACALKVMRVMMELNRLGKHATKRDVYYTDVDIFENQSTVDSLVDDFACKLRVSRRHLRIVASGRGCIAGRIKFREAGVSVNGMHYLSAGKVIHPIVEQITEIDARDTSFVLVIEKDALFMRLVEEGFVQQYRCAVVTSKGYPDVATRLFLHKLSKENSQLPIYCMTDFDPHGIEIAMTYYYGALSRMDHQRHELQCRTMIWIGLNLKQDFHDCRIPIDSLLEMGRTDHAKASTLLSMVNQAFYTVQDEFIGSYASVVTHAMNKKRWAESLDLMLQSSKKAEIECLNSVSLDFMISQYLPWKITLVRQEQQ